MTPERDAPGSHVPNTKMTSKPVNLRQYRKRKQREDKARQAEANRLAHGTPKSLSEPVREERERLLRELEAKKLDGNDADKPA